MHEHSRSLRVGGYISSGVLILFGVAVIVLGIWALLFTRDHIEQQNIVFGPATIRPQKSTPRGGGPANRWTQVGRRSRWPRSCASTPSAAPAG